MDKKDAFCLSKIRDGGDGGGNSSGGGGSRGDRDGRAPGMTMIY